MDRYPEITFVSTADKIINSNPTAAPAALSRRAPATQPLTAHVHLWQRKAIPCAPC
jgi:hypothetical protein